MCIARELNRQCRADSEPTHPFGGYEQRLSRVPSKSGDPSRARQEHGNQFVAGIVYNFERSAAVGIRPSGVYLSTASGRFFESLVRISSRDIPVFSDKVASTSGPIACSS